MMCHARDIAQEKGEVFKMDGGLRMMFDRRYEKECVAKLKNENGAEMSTYLGETSERSGDSGLGSSDEDSPPNSPLYVKSLGEIQEINEATA